MSVDVGDNSSQHCVAKKAGRQEYVLMDCNNTSDVLAMCLIDSKWYIIYTYGQVYASIFNFSFERVAVTIIA